MGADYYTYIQLQIRFSKTDARDSTFIELDRQNGYFYFNYDEDYPDYNEKYDEYVKKILDYEAPAIKIYENDKFINPACHLKYYHMVSEELAKKNKTWADVVLIEKVAYNI